MANTSEEFFDALTDIHPSTDNVDVPEEPCATISDPNFVDEDHLKELETILTEGQKNENREKGLGLKEEGNQLFKSGAYKDAIDKYSQALAICPPSFCVERAQMYANRAAAQMKMDNYTPAIDDCTLALKLDETYWKALFRRAFCYEQNEELWHLALDDYKAHLEANPTNAASKNAIHRLTPMIDARNERMKAEMMGKLKDLGNVILGKFGLSTDNFRMEPNAEGGYSVKMDRN